MKIPKPILLILTAFLAFAAYSPRAHAHDDDDDTYSYFYDNLSPYGEWVQTDDYGYVWHPTGVDENWAPYTDGYWAYTDDGWTWVSYEDYGGITYHYGRWARLADEGWVWVPGSEWAPAWVSWRHSDDYVGWAPLPPEARWREGVGFGVWADSEYDIGPGCYAFVSVGNFGAPALRSVILGRDQNVTIINQTTNITNITENNGRVYVGGPRYAEIAARSTRPIQTLKLVRQSNAAAIHAAGGKLLSHTQGNQLIVLAPKIAAPAAGEHLAPSKVAKNLGAAKPEHGWSVVKDPAEREKLKADIKTQANGATPESAPAKAISAEEAKLPTPIKGTGKGVTSTATASATPRTKGKKGKPATETVESETGAPGATAATAEATPKSSTKGKSRKSKTPSSEEETAPKAPKNSNLQPFLGGGDEAAPTPKKKHTVTPEDTGAYEEPKTKVPKDTYEEPKTKSSKESSDTYEEPKAKMPKNSSEAYGEPAVKSSKYSDTGAGGSKADKSPKGKKKGDQDQPQ